jgi:hypothetical protein
MPAGEKAKTQSSPHAPEIVNPAEALSFVFAIVRLVMA